jgi:hypothetical protein
MSDEERYDELQAKTRNRAGNKRQKTTKKRKPNSSKPSKRATGHAQTDATVIRQDLSDGNGEGFWSGRMGRVLGSFPAEKGQKYRIDLEVLEDGSALEPYHPSLEVRVDPFTLDGYAMGEGFSELAGLVVGGIGVLLIAPVLPLWGWLVTKKSRSSPTTK